MADAIIPLNADGDGLEISGLFNGPTPSVPGARGTLLLIGPRTRGRGQQALPGCCPEFLKFILGKCRCLSDTPSKCVVSRGRHHETRKCQ